MKANRKLTLLVSGLALVMMSTYGVAENNVAVAINTSADLPASNGVVLPMPRGGLPAGLTTTSAPTLPPFLLQGPAGVSGANQAVLPIAVPNRQGGQMGVANDHPLAGVLPRGDGRAMSAPVLPPFLSQPNVNSSAVVTTSDANSAATNRYWTPSRIAGAKPMPMPVPPMLKVGDRPVKQLPPNRGGKGSAPGFPGGTIAPPGDRTNWKPFPPVGTGMNCSNGRECFSFPPSTGAVLPPGLTPTNPISPMPLVKNPDTPVAAPTLPPMLINGPVTNWPGIEH